MNKKELKMYEAPIMEILDFGVEGELMAVSFAPIEPDPDPWWSREEQPEVIELSDEI